MKEFFKMFFASLLAMVLSGIVLIVIFIASIVAIVSNVAESDKEKEATPANSVLVIDLDDALHEQGEDNSFAVFEGGESSDAGLYEVMKALDKASGDNDIKGLLIKTTGGSNGWATMQQLKKAIDAFHASGKFIYAYGEQLTQRDYYIASSADSIYLNPAGAPELKGLATQLMFFKGTLDKLEVAPEIFYAGKFKSATEPFRTDRMSEPNKVQVAALQKDIWSVFTEGAAKHGRLHVAAIDSLTQNGAVQFPQEALAHKYVDGLLYFDEVEDRIRIKTGQKTKDKINYIGVDKYAENISSGGFGNDRIAVLFAEGEIVDGEKNDDYQIASETFTKSIREIRNNEKVKAVVLRVNSPGGSAMASEVILRELQLLKASGKPIIVSMGDYAASGGYYISCMADSIFALPTTITGSIGVFGMMFNTEQLMKNKLGITFDGVKNAPYADFPNTTRAMTEAEKIKMQRAIDTIYAKFKGHVATGRKIDPVMVDSIAQGRVWTGKAALEIGLVDKLGNLQDAINCAAAKAKLKDYSVHTYPARVDKWESVMRRIKSSGLTAEVVKEQMKKEAGVGYEWIKQLRSLKNMNGKAMMAMPFRLSFD